MDKAKTDLELSGGGPLCPSTTSITPLVHVVLSNVVMPPVFQATTLG
jgi:hypothetical protein